MKKLFGYYLALSVLLMSGVSASEVPQKTKPNEGMQYAEKANKPAKKPDHYFTVSFKQFGLDVPVKNHMVELKKEPFSIIIVMNGIDAVCANFNTDSYIFDGFARGLPIWKIIKPVEKFMGMAEYNKNAENDIIISEYSCHYLYYENQDDNRFNSVTVDGDTLICERIVENIFSQEKSKSIPVKECQYKNIYAVFLYAKLFDVKQPMEYQKEYIKIKFVK